eukprot:m.65637 g.65637  ORF g.65637 m.65637 type:complete len:399 (-) comp12066_c0_seq2:866-2062(-)
METAAIHGLELQAKALTSRCVPEVEGTDDDDASLDVDDISLFIVGTSSVKVSGENSLHFLQFSDEFETISADIVAFPQGEILSLSASPSHSELFGCIWQDLRTGARAADVFRYKKGDEDGSSNITSLAVEFPGTLTPSAMAWHPNRNTFALVGTGGVASTFSIESVDRAKPLWHGKVPHSDTLAQLSASALPISSWPSHCACWDPHQGGNTIVVGVGSAVIGCDSRNGKEVYSIPHAHTQTVRAIHVNPNKQYTIITGGQDGYIRVWDTRHPEACLAQLQHHTHWVYAVQYNPFHDMLILSAGSDAKVLLNCIASQCSGHPSADLTDEATDEDMSPEQLALREQMKTDCVLASSDEHEDSVYAACWSQSEPWTFASLSFDGRIIIGRVPRAIKYSILL